MVVRLVVGLAITVIAVAISGRRARYLYKLISSERPAHGRTDGLNQRIRTQFVEVIGQRKLLKWSVPGIAHALMFWGFLILGFTIVET